MSTRSNRIIYRIATGILSVVVMMYVANSIFNHEIFAQRFAALGYPTYIIYPLTFAKILGLIAIWSNTSRTLKEWAYAGFFFDFVLAFFAEVHAADGEYFSSPIAISALFTSYFLWKRQ